MLSGGRLQVAPFFCASGGWFSNILTKLEAFVFVHFHHLCHGSNGRSTLDGWIGFIAHLLVMLSCAANLNAITHVADRPWASDEDGRRDNTVIMRPPVFYVYSRAWSAIGPFCWHFLWFSS